MARVRTNGTIGLTATTGMSDPWASVAAPHITADIPPHALTVDMYHKKYNVSQARARSFLYERYRAGDVQRAPRIVDGDRVYFYWPSLQSESGAGK